MRGSSLNLFSFAAISCCAMQNGSFSVVAVNEPGSYSLATILTTGVEAWP